MGGQQEDSWGGTPPDRAKSRESGFGSETSSNLNFQDSALILWSGVRVREPHQVRGRVFGGEGCGARGGRAIRQCQPRVDSGEMKIFEFEKIRFGFSGFRARTDVAPRMPLERRP